MATLQRIPNSSRCALGAAVLLLLLTPCLSTAQTVLRSYAVSHGAGVSAGESTRLIASVGLPAAGIAHNLEGAGGAGFWYATRERLVILANEKDPLPDGIPQDFELHANYPNPFNPTTRIRYGVPKAAFVTIGIFNILGQLVSEPVADDKAAGYYEFEWDGRDRSGSHLPSGVYFYRLRAGDFVATRSMILQK